MYNACWIGVVFSFECAVAIADNSTCLVRVYQVAVKASKALLNTNLIALSRGFKAVKTKKVGEAIMIIPS